MSGNGGNDTLSGGAGADRLLGGDGFDFASYEGASASVVVLLESPSSNSDEAAGDTFDSIEGVIGSSHNDHLGGNELANHLVGGGGDDLLVGGRGDDTLDGGTGTDTIHLTGFRWDYSLTRNADGTWTVVDLMAGRDGTDTLRNVELVRFFDVTIDLSAANAPSAPVLSNTQFYENAEVGAVLAELSATDPDGDPVVFTLKNTDVPFAIYGNQLVLTGPLDYETRAQYTLTVEAWDPVGFSSMQTFTIDVLDVYEPGPNPQDPPSQPNSPAVPQPMLIRGTSKNDRLNGDAADDTIYGGSGNDTLRGLDGNDRLHGGAGKDTLYGGNGKDIFVFDTKPNVRTNVDRIADFKVKDDTIWLDNKFYKSLGKSGSEKKPAALKKAFFTIGSEAKDSNDYLIYNKKTGKLYYDADGSGQGQQVQIATLSKNLKLTNKDFFVI